MKAHFQLEQFSGPLDLLLSLINEQKLDITELAISEVTEQYLNYLETLEEKKPEELADFLVIATRLLLLKSKTLLPQLVEEDEDGPSLEEQLRLYKAFVEASHKLNKKWLSGQSAKFRIEPPRRPVSFTPPTNFSNDSLLQSMQKLLNRLKPLKELPQRNIDSVVTVKEKFEYIKNLLKKAKQLSFSQALNNAESRTEVIYTFLALLELVKQKSIVLKQSDNFGEIMINKV